MKELVLLAGEGQVPPKGCRCGDGGADGRLVVLWEGWEAPRGQVSLPQRLRGELEAVRAEHMAWAHDLGRLRVGGRHVADRLRAGEGLSMWWCSLLYERHPKMTPGLYTVYKLRALERLMEAEGVTALKLCGGDGPLRRALGDMCAAGGRAFSLAHEPGVDLTPASSLFRRMYNACPAPLRAWARYAHWWWTVRRKLPPTAAGAAPQAGAAGPTGTIATYFPNVDMKAAGAGRFRSRYWESLHDALNAASEREGAPLTRWLFIRFPAPQLSLEQCLALRDRFRREGKDGASFHYLEEFLRHRDLWAALWRHWRLCLASLRLERAVRPAFRFAGSNLNFWEYLGPYWAESFRGWRALERCLQQRGCTAYVRWAGPQRWTLFPLENCPWERMLTHAVHTAGHGPVLGAQHSTIRPTDFRYFDDPRTFEGECAAFQPDAVRGNGLSACRQWLEAGMPPERLQVVEALRYLYLAPAGKREEEGEGSAPAPEEAGGPRRLLAVTSFFRDETEAHLVLLARAVHSGLLDGWEVVVKPHPYLPVEERLRALLGRRAAEVRVAQGAIADELRPGVAVWASNSTTAVLEAALKGLPVLAMLPVDDFDLCPLQDVPELPRTGTLEDVAHALRRTAPLRLPEGYLDLDPALPRWKDLLGL